MKFFYKSFQVRGRTFAVSNLGERNWRCRRNQFGQLEMGARIAMFELDFYGRMPDISELILGTKMDMNVVIDMFSYNAPVLFALILQYHRDFDCSSFERAAQLTDVIEALREPRPRATPSEEAVFRNAPKMPNNGLAPEVEEVLDHLEIIRGEWAKRQHAAILEFVEMIPNLHT